MTEVFRSNIEKIEASQVLNQLDLEKKIYCYISASRRKIDLEKIFYVDGSALMLLPKPMICPLFTLFIPGVKK